MSAAVRATQSLALCTLALASAFAWLATAAQPQSTAADGIADGNAQAFLTSLQTAVRSDDRRRIAKLVHYPLRVNHTAAAGGTAPPPRTVANEAAFVQGYGAIFTPKVRDAVLRQDPAKLFRNAQGAMIGNGEVWFAGVCRTAGCAHPVLGITAVNVPR